MYDAQTGAFQGVQRLKLYEYCLIWQLPDNVEVVRREVRGSDVAKELSAWCQDLRVIGRLNLQAKHQKSSTDSAVIGYRHCTTNILKMAGKKSSFNLQTCARSNILALEPYRCARE
jgi:hypothetical protein